MALGRLGKGVFAVLHHCRGRENSRGRLPDRIPLGGLAEMPVVLFHHAGIGVPEHWGRACRMKAEGEPEIQTISAVLTVWMSGIETG